MIQRTIAVVDLDSGKITDCRRDTLTLDIPADLDRKACVASGDAGTGAHYLSVSGTTLVNPAHPRPLSWRVRGEEGLVAKTRGKSTEIAYRLCTVDPAPS
jgi:hypothetical protein